MKFTLSPDRISPVYSKQDLYLKAPRATHGSWLRRSFGEFLLTFCQLPCGEKVRSYPGKRGQKGLLRGNCPSQKLPVRFHGGCTEWKWRILKQILAARSKALRIVTCAGSLRAGADRSSRLVEINLDWSVSGICAAYLRQALRLQAKRSCGRFGPTPVLALPLYLLGP